MANINKNQQPASKLDADTPQNPQSDSGVTLHRPDTATSKRIELADINSNSKPKPKSKSKSKNAEKTKIHPRFAKGKYQNIRLITMYGFLAVFLLMPWLRFDGRQAIWMDIASPKFYFFNLVLAPQDFYFFAFVFIIAGLALFMVSVYAGRVWCGYLCPQTIYVHLYQYTEKLIIGERNKRIKFDKEKINAAKFTKLTAVHSLWLIYSLITAFTFVALVAGVDNMIGGEGLLFFMDWGKYTWIFMGIITFATYANAAFMREAMCFYMCPYGRFQSVMVDKDTLIISYDSERGEPRGAKKNDPTLGDCVNCTLCVQVCPTGIDIRDGLQMECIQCAACVDACNEVMDKVGKPRGLIRYTTERQLVHKEPTRILSWRIFAYIFVLSLLTAAATYMLVGRSPIGFELTHDRRQLSKVGRDGLIQNSYVIRLSNKTDQKQTYVIKLEPIDGITLKSRFQEIPLQAGANYDWPVSLYADPAKLSQERTPITVTVSTKDGAYSQSRQDYFINK